MITSLRTLSKSTSKKKFSRTVNWIPISVQAVSTVRIRKSTMSGPLDRYFAKQGNVKLIRLRLDLPMKDTKQILVNEIPPRQHQAVQILTNQPVTKQLQRRKQQGPSQYKKCNTTRARRPTFRHWPTAIDVIETNNDENSDLSENWSGKNKQDSRTCSPLSGWATSNV